MTPENIHVTAAQVRAARALLGWNQQELANRAKVAPSTVADFERGKRTPVSNNLDAIRAVLESNGVAFRSGGAVVGPQPSANQPQLSREGKPVRLVTAADLEQWADRLDSKALFPQLMDRLILATTGNVFKQLRFPADESIQREGWDGICEQDASKTVPWLPVGVSGWELATQRQNLVSKANDDCKKRTSNPRGLKPDDSIFVFATLRNWDKGAEWAKTKKAEGQWADLKVLDANDLVHWIELYPAVGYWLASYLRKLPTGLLPIEDLWNEWRQATDWPLNTEILLAGRDDEAIDTLKWLRAEPSVRTVQADSPEEAMAFLYASIDILPEPHRQFYLMRCLRVFTAEDARMLSDSPSPLVIVLEASEPGLASRLAQKGHHVYVAHGSSIGISEVNIVLPRSTFEDFQTALEHMGILADEAERLARDSFRSLAVLRRLVPSTTIAEPEWATEPQSRILLTALLAGAWDSACPGDLAALQVLSNNKYEELARSLPSFIGAPDSPLRTAGSTWKVSSPRDAWFRLAKLIAKDDLERFSAVAKSVLGAADPRFEMDPEERWLAAIRGKLRDHSPWLVAGLSETLLLLAMFGSQAKSVPNAQSYAADVVSSLLKHADAERWYSLSHQLRTLAEAAPDEFLNALEDSLAQDDSPVMALFKEDGGPLFGGANHSELLWSLEVLAWDPKYLSRATTILAKLDERDPGGKWANRPKSSLRSIFLLWKPQTHATLAQRFLVLDYLRRQESNSAWRLMLSLLPSGHDWMSPNPHPKWRVSPGDTAEEITYGLIGEGASELSKRLLEDAGQDSARWVQLIDAIPNLAQEFRSKVFAELAKLSQTLKTDEVRIPIWTALRNLLGHHRSFPDTHWALPKEVLNEAEAVYHRFQPEDQVNCRVWLFSDVVSLLQGQQGTDWDARTEELYALRRSALAELMNQFGISVIPPLIEKAARPFLVGVALAQNASSADELDSYLFSALGNPALPMREFVRGLIGALQYRFGSAWQSCILTRARKDDWSSLKVLQVLEDLPSTSETWKAAASFGDDMRTAYWKVAQFWPRDDDEGNVYGAEQLLEVGRARKAIHAIAGSRRQLPSELVSKLLNQAVLESQASDQIDGNDQVMFQWSVCQLLRRLDEDPAVEEAEIARLEWIYLPLLEHSERPPVVLHRWMSKQPSFFVEVISAIYRAHSKSSSDYEVITESQKSLASQAYRLMESWTTVPGTEDGSSNSEALHVWVKEAHRLAVNAERGSIGDSYIGRILSHSKPDENGVWPPQHVRELLEEMRNDHIESGIVSGVHNQRGVTSRGMLDGGTLEREEAFQYRKWSDAVKFEWPRTASLLERIASSFDESARLHDENAERTQWSY